MRSVLVLLICGAAGCGFSENKFLVKGVDLWCDRSAECAGTFEKQACIDLIRSEDRSDCDYDPAMAKECWQLLPDAECLVDDLVDVSVLDVPAACLAVYACP